MNDGNRVYPVNKLIMHHAVSDNMENWDDLAVQDWFSNVGKARGYSNGAVNPYHEHPGRPGQLTYSMAQYCLRRYTKDGNKYGWRLTELIKDPFQNVAWHCGNWGANQTSIGIETAGEYSSSDIDDKALMLVADTLARPWDEELGGGLYIYGHKDWFATACPGRIYDKLNTLIDMTNDVEKWTNALWPPQVPPPAPAPAPTTKEVPAAKELPVKVTFYANQDNTSVWDLTTNPDYKAVKLLKKDEPFEAFATIDFNGSVYYTTKYSFDRGNRHGVNRADVHEAPVVVAPPVIVPPVVVPPKEPEVTPVPEPETPTPEAPDYDKENNSILKDIQVKVNQLIEWFKKTFNIGK